MRRQTERSPFPRLVSPRFVVKKVTIDRDAEVAFDAAQWCDAIVFVERGRLELVTLNGSVEAFGAGAIIWFDGLPLRALRNAGAEQATLVGLARSPRHLLAAHE